MEKALGDVIVLDLTQVLAGPFGVTILADFGANVIQIEPVTGDYHRRLLASRPTETKRLNAWNRRRNRRCMTLNLRSTEGKEIFLELVKKADVVVHNFSPGTMDRLGLGYDTLKEANPSIIYCSISGFGETGPYKSRLAYDPIIQATSGMMSMTGFADGPPLRTGPNIADYAGAVYAVIGIMIALHYKNRTGKGQMIDCSMFDAMCHWTVGEIGAYMMGKDRYGNQHPWAVMDVYETKDGQFLLFAIQTDAQWERFLKLAGKEDILAEKWSFDTRIKRNDEIQPWCRDWVKSKTLEEARRELDGAEIANSNITSAQELAQDPQVLERGMFNIVEDPVCGVVEGVIGVAPKLSETPGTIGAGEHALPELSQHTEEVLYEFLGYSKDKVAKLREEGIV